MVIPLIIITDQ